MAKNIEINILNSSGSYETLYPTTDYNNLLNKPTIPTVPSLPLSIANGGTAGNSAANAVYNLLQGLNSRTSSNINSYASSTYLGCYYGSTGYKIPISNLMTYINNNVSVSGGFKYSTGSVTNSGTGKIQFIPSGLSTVIVCFAHFWNNTAYQNLYGGFGIAMAENTGYVNLTTTDATTNEKNYLSVNGSINYITGNTVVFGGITSGVFQFLKQSGLTTSYLAIGT